MGLFLHDYTALLGAIPPIYTGAFHESRFICVYYPFCVFLLRIYTKMHTIRYRVPTPHQVDSITGILLGLAKHKSEKIYVTRYPFQAVAMVTKKRTIHAAQT